MSNFKISIIGCGNVGATTAYTLLSEEIASEICIFDINRDKTRGIVLDFQHAQHFLPNTKITAAKELKDTTASDLIIITAGAKQKPGQTREDLTINNKKIFEQLIPESAQHSPNSILLIVTNPVDALTFYAKELSGFSKEKVIGTGTLLDTFRFKYHLSQDSKINPQNIHTYVLGEHGDSSLPYISGANIAGKPITKILQKQQINSSFKDTQQAAYRIINDVGYTCYSIAQVCKEITKAIVQDSNKILPVSTYLNGEYDLKDISLSVPCQINKQGVAKVIEIPLSKNETKLLKNSATKIKSMINS